MLALAYTLTTKRQQVTIKDQAVIVAASLSHFLMEVPSHREGKLVPRVIKK